MILVKSKIYEYRLIKDDFEYIEHGWVYLSIRKNYRKLLGYHICQGFNDWHIATAHAAEKEQKELIDFFISKAVFIWGYALCYAITGGYENLMHFFLSKITFQRTWNDEMLSAATIGNVKLVRFFASKGADDWYHCTKIASEMNHKKLKNFIENRNKIS